MLFILFIIIITDCDTMLTTFEKHPHKVIYGYNTLGWYMGPADDCLQQCLSKPGCVQIEYFSSYGACYFSDITIQMMKDASPDIIRTHTSDMYIRRCM